MSSLSSLLSSLSSSSSSIDLSSILQAATGASSAGIDVTSAVSAAVTAAQAPETAWENQQATLESQISALTSIQTAATSLDNDMLALNSLTGSLADRTASSSDSSLVTASASSGAATGNHVVVVNSLASTALWTSGTLSSSTSDMAAGSFTITDASGTAQTITTDGSETLSDVANTINNDNLGVKASVVTDANGARLEIAASTSGSASNFTVSSTTSSYGFTQAVPGANASLTVDGVSLSSASNTVTGAISGVTLNLLSAPASGEAVTLSISPDTSSASTAISQFVSDYNTLIGDLNTQFTVTNSAEGPLAGDTTVRNLQSELLGSLSYTFSPASGTTTVGNLSDLGISVTNTGTLSVDSSKLTSALQNNFSDVQNFFQGSALNGFANSLDQTLTSFTSSDNGAFTVDLKSMNGQVTDLQTDITTFETNVITPLKAQLTSDYDTAEYALQELPTELKQIQEELGNNSSN